MPHSCDNSVKVEDTDYQQERKRKFDIVAKEDPAIGESQAKLKKKKKDKKNDNCLTLSSVTSRLQAIGEELFPIALDASLRDVAVSRLFMKDHYGGNTQSTYPKIGKKFLDKHGFDDFMYPKLENNPHAPQSPGAPGLLYRALPAPAYDWPKEQRLFIGLAVNIWLYVGQYRLSPAPSLTRQEWLQQDLEFRKKWVKIIETKGRGLTMRAKLLLKKELGRDPTQEELKKAITEAPKPAKGRVKFQVSAEEIEEAYDNGDEQIPIWCMKCVGYDEAFQRDVAQKFSQWNAKKSANVKQSKTRPTQKRKSRRAASFDSDDGADSDD